VRTFLGRLGESHIDGDEAVRFVASVSGGP